LNRHTSPDGSAPPRNRGKTTDGDRSDPAVTADASSHGDTASAGHRPAAAAAAAATAATASPSALPAGSSGTGSAASVPASRVKRSRTAPAAAAPAPGTARS